MIIIGIILGFVGLAYLCWLLFALAVYALPLFAAVGAGLATYHSGSGPIAAIIVSGIAGSITLIAGQVAFVTLRSPLIRATIAALFALPAAVAIMPPLASRTSPCLPKVGNRPWQLEPRSPWRLRPGRAWHFRPARCRARPCRGCSVA